MSRQYQMVPGAAPDGPVNAPFGVIETYTGYLVAVFVHDNRILSAGGSAWPHYTRRYGRRRAVYHWTAGGFAHCSAMSRATGSGAWWAEPSSASCGTARRA